MTAPANPTLAVLPEFLIPLDSTAAEPLYRQVYRGLRDGILEGRLGAGTRIPSTRRLAQQLRVSRSTVLVAFDQLVAEGYVVGSVGSGSYVARQIPGHLLRARPAATASGPALRANAPIGALAQQVGCLPRLGWRVKPGPFQPGIPPIDQFPTRLWSRLTARRMRDLSPSHLYHGPAGGHPPLRSAIAEYLMAVRGVRCTPDQVIVLTSAQEGLQLAARVLLNPGDSAWLEDPTWTGAHGALIAANATVVHVPLDDEGLSVERGIALQPAARLAYVSPSHQFPTGVIMSLERRLALLDWARRQGSWIIEDDYDSEFRYAGRPLTALQGLDEAGSVLYVGTFNKTLFPSLRIGYAVVPAPLVRPFLTVRGLGGQHVSTLDQAVLADFISEGHYARHMHRMRMVGRDRRDALVRSAREHLVGLLRVPVPVAGIHTVGWLSPGASDLEASAAAARHDLEVAPLSRCYSGPCPRRGLLLGYGATAPAALEAAIQRLAAALRTVATPGPVEPADPPHPAGPSRAAS